MGKSVILNTEYWENAFDLSMPPVYGNEVYIDVANCPLMQVPSLDINNIFGQSNKNTFIKRKNGSNHYRIVDVHEYDYVKIITTSSSPCLCYLTNGPVTSGTNPWGFNEAAFVGFPDNTKHCQLYVEPNTSRVFNIRGASHIYVTQNYNRVNSLPLFMILGKNS